MGFLRELISLIHIGEEDRRTIDIESLKIIFGKRNRRLNMKSPTPNYDTKNIYTYLAHQKPICSIPPVHHDTEQSNLHNPLNAEGQNNFRPFIHILFPPPRRSSHPDIIHPIYQRACPSWRHQHHQLSLSLSLSGGVRALCTHPPPIHPECFLWGGSFWYDVENDISPGILLTPLPFFDGANC